MTYGGVEVVKCGILRIIRLEVLVVVAVEGEGGQLVKGECCGSGNVIAKLYQIFSSS